MYKVSYYVRGTDLAFKRFKTIKEACAFALTLGSFDVLEIKLYEEHE